MANRFTEVQVEYLKTQSPILQSTKADATRVAKITAHLNGLSPSNQHTASSVVYKHRSLLGLYKRTKEERPVRGRKVGVPNHKYTPEQDSFLVERHQTKKPWREIAGEYTKKFGVPSNRETLRRRFRTITKNNGDRKRKSRKVSNQQKPLPVCLYSILVDGKVIWRGQKNPTGLILVEKTETVGAL